MKYQILVLEYVGHGYTKTGNYRPFYGKLRSLTLNSEKTIQEVKAELESVVFHTYQVQVREILGSSRSKSGKSKPKVGRVRSFTLKTNSDIEQIKAEIGRKLDIQIRGPGRPRKKQQEPR